MERVMMKLRQLTEWIHWLVNVMDRIIIFKYEDTVNFQAGRYCIFKYEDTVLILQCEDTVMLGGTDFSLDF